MYDEALLHVPRSYKLWRLYIQERRAYVGSLPAAEMPDATIELNIVYERALLTLYTMPRIWLSYLEWLMKQKRVTYTRRTFDRALQALPLTLHHRIWPLFVQFATLPSTPGPTARVIFDRYLLFTPTAREVAIDHLLASEHWGEAARAIADALEDPTFAPASGRTLYDIVDILATTITSHPTEVAHTGVDVDQVIHNLVANFPTGAGRHMSALARYHDALGNHARAAHVCIAALKSAVTVSDFQEVFDTFTELETTRLRNNIDKSGKVSQLDAFGLIRLERIVSGSGLLLMDVGLRRNPNNVAVWHKKAKMSPDPVTVYRAAINTVPLSVSGVQSLYLALGRLLPDNHADKLYNDLLTMKNEEEMGAKAFAEVMLEHLERRLLTTGDVLSVYQTLDAFLPHPTQPRLTDARLFALYTDLAVHLHSATKLTRDAVRAAYERAIGCHAASPLTFIAYARWDSERSLRIWDRAVTLTPYPAAVDLWQLYITAVMRDGAGGIERVRFILSRAIKDSPPKYSHLIASIAIKFELTHGRARRAGEAAAGMLNAAVPRVAADSALVAAHRCLWGRRRVGVDALLAALNRNDLSLTDLSRVAICLSALLTSLKSVDAARSVFRHVHSSMHSKKEDLRAFWDAWTEFEFDHGDSHTVNDVAIAQRTGAQLAVSGGAEAGDITLQPDLYTGMDELTAMIKRVAGEAMATEDKMEVHVEAADKLERADFEEERHGARVS